MGASSAGAGARLDIARWDEVYRMLNRPRSRSRVKISMYLGSSKYWWAYLGLRCNPALLSQIDPRFDRAVFFDEAGLLPVLDAPVGKQSVKYFYLFWDGIGDPGEIDKIR